jgi:hypothetical protein
MKPPWGRGVMESGHDANPCARKAEPWILAAGGANPWNVPDIALLVVASDNKFISEGIKVYGHGKKMADVLNSYDARLQSEN